MKRLKFQNRILHRQSQQSNEIAYKQLFTMQVKITRSSLKKKKKNDVSARVPESSNHLVSNAQCYDTQDRFPRVLKPLRVSIIIHDKIGFSICFFGQFKLHFLQYRIFPKSKTKLFFSKRRFIDVFAYTLKLYLHYYSFINNPIV